MPSLTGRLAGEAVVALAWLTRLPIGRLHPGDSSAGASVWAYPLVGVVVGGLGAMALWAARAVGVPGGVAAAYSLIAMALVTGGLHEDGLADTADGLGGGATRERKLAIMRDSRIGGFGALALVLSVAVRGGALTGLPPVAVVVAASLARAAMLPLLLLPAARSDGLAAALGVIDRRRAASAMVIAPVMTVLLVPAVAAALAILVAAVAGLGMAWLGWRQVGGHTGDLCGAAEQVAECLTLTALAAAFAR